MTLVRAWTRRYDEASVQGGVATMFEDPKEMRERLEALKTEHRDLDALIIQLSQNPFQDQLQVTRLKRRKLQLKDAIARLESKLIPDLNA